MNLAASRRRLFRLHLGASGLLLVLLSLALWLLVGAQLRRQLQRQLEQTARAITFSVERQDGQVRFEESAWLATREGHIVLDREAVVEWLNPRGEVVQRQGGLRLPAPACVVTLAARDRQGFFGSVRVAQSWQPLERRLRQTVAGVALLGGLLVLLSAAANWWWMGRVLAPIQTAYDELAVFAGAVSHELRSPLTALQTNGQSLLRHWERLEPGELRQGVEELVTVSEEMARTVHAVLWLARLEREEPPCLEPVDLPRVAAAVVAEFPAGPVGLLTNLRPARVLADERMVCSLLRNLVENGLAYTEPGGTVEVGCAGTELWVKDTGLGLTLEQLQHVFEPFWRAETSRARHLGGAGLGLAIAQRLAEACSAHLSVASRWGEGSEFRCRFWKA